MEERREDTVSQRDDDRRQLSLDRDRTVVGRVEYGGSTLLWAPYTALYTVLYTVLRSRVC
jgi:hypothetical protein